MTTVLTTCRVFVSLNKSRVHHTEIRGILWLAQFPKKERCAVLATVRMATTRTGKRQLWSLNKTHVLRILICPLTLHSLNQIYPVRTHFLLGTDMGAHAPAGPSSGRETVRSPANATPVNP